MQEIRFTQCPRDSAVFCIGTWRNHSWAACAFRIDDETGVGSLHQLDRVATMFREMCGISGKGRCIGTLGIGVSRDHSSHTISLSQEAYICNLVERFGLHNATIVTTPLAPGAILTKDQCPATAEELRDVHNNNYRELISSLQYVAVAT